MALYADIIEIVAPSSAGEGEIVTIQVGIKNIADFAITVLKAAGFYDGGKLLASVSFPTPSNVINPGVTYYSVGTFTMPSSSGHLTAYSFWRGADGTWNLDDEMTKNISLAVVPPTFQNFAIGEYVKV